MQFNNLKKHLLRSSFIAFTLLFWIWFVSSGYFWELSKKHDVLLPYLPVISWIIPGTLWMQAKWLFLIILVLVPLLKLILFRFEKIGWYRFLFLTVMICLIIINLISVVWGLLLLKLLS